jgi:hypothetical protein
MFIPDPDLDFLPIPDPGVKKAPDPGSGSATLQRTMTVRYLMSVDVNAQLHGLHDRHRHLFWQNVRHDVDAVHFRLRK